MPSRVWARKRKSATRNQAQPGMVSLLSLSGMKVADLKS